MKINSVFVEQHGSGQNVIVSFHLPGEVELDETDVARLVDVAREAAGAGTEDAAEAPKRGRGRPAAKAEADSDTAAEPPKRGRGRPRKEAEEAAAAEPAEEKPALRRRRGAAAIEEEEGITDADLVKAVSEAAEVLGRDAVQELIGDFKVKVVSDIAQDEREEFIKLLNENVEDAAK